MLKSRGDCIGLGLRIAGGGGGATVGGGARYIAYFSISLAVSYEGPDDAPPGGPDGSVDGRLPGGPLGDGVSNKL